MPEENFIFIPARRLSGLPLPAKEKWKIRYREERMRKKGYSENEIKPPVAVSVRTYTGFMIVSG